MGGTPVGLGCSSSSSSSSLPHAMIIVLVSTRREPHQHNLSLQQRMIIYNLPHSCVKRQCALISIFHCKFCVITLQAPEWICFPRFREIYPSGVRDLLAAVLECVYRSHPVPAAFHFHISALAQKFSEYMRKLGRLGDIAHIRYAGGSQKGGGLACPHTGFQITRAPQNTACVWLGGSCCRMTRGIVLCDHSAECVTTQN